MIDAAQLNARIGRKHRGPWQLAQPAEASRAVGALQRAALLRTVLKLRGLARLRAALALGSASAPADRA